MTNTDIHSRVLLTYLSIGTWSARKYDRKISEKVNHEYLATTDAGRYNKHLLPGDCPAYKTLTSLASSIRMAHYAKTLAWTDEGWRVLPTDAYMGYTQWFREQQSAFDAALDTFVADYPDMVLQARTLLNGMYKDEDYPSANDTRKRFRLSVDFMPLPHATDIRADLPANMLAEIERNIVERTENAFKTATADAWGRLHKVVLAVSERLSSPDAIFRDSLLENVRETCKALDSLNITGDRDLDTMTQRALSVLTVVPADMLRDDKTTRASVAQSADQIVAAMAQFYAPESE